jgi:hypothetical protein
VTRREAEQVLRNWIAQALDPGARLPDGTDPVTFAACNFIEWWRRQIEDTASELGDAFQARWTRPVKAMLLAAYRNSNRWNRRSGSTMP